MAESTLSATFTTLQVAVGDFLGFGRDTAAWTSDETDRVEEVLQSGIREFYTAHDWSFLKHITSIVLWSDVAVDADVTVTGVHSAGTTTVTASGGTPFYATMIGRSIVITDIGTFTITGYTSSTVISVSGNATCTSKTFSIDAEGGIYQLEDAFAGIEGTFLEYDSSENRYGRIRLSNASEVVSNHSLDTATGEPRIAAIAWKTSTNAAGQRAELRVWPEPDQDYTVWFWQRVNPDKLTSSLAYHLGGMQHSETIKLSCLAKAELYGDDELGMYTQMYEQRLQRSIQRDMQHGYSAENLGPMTDHSDSRNGYDPRYHTRVTWDGVQY